MKKLLFALLLPCITYAQNIVKDTVYIQKKDTLYYLITSTIYNDSTLNLNKQLLGDSITTINTIVSDAERQVNAFAIYAAKIITGNRFKNRVQYFNNLHQQISGKPVYVSTALRDSAFFLADWDLFFNGEKIDGKIELNNNKRLIFNPDNGKVYTINSNLLLSTFTNQISFSFNNVKYDLYKYANDKFATIDNDVKLIKRE